MSENKNKDYVVAVAGLCIATITLLLGDNLLGRLFENDTSQEQYSDKSQSSVNQNGDNVDYITSNEDSGVKISPEKDENNIVVQIVNDISDDRNYDEYLGRFFIIFLFCSMKDFNFSPL